jgi:hypothetical protein
MSNNRTLEFPCACRQWAGIWPSRWQFRFCICSAEMAHESDNVKPGEKCVNNCTYKNSRRSITQLRTFPLGCGRAASGHTAIRWRRPPPMAAPSDWARSLEASPASLINTYEYVEFICAHGNQYKTRLCLVATSRKMVQKRARGFQKTDHGIHALSAAR